MKHVVLGAACSLALLSACSQHAPSNSTASEPATPTAPAAAAAKAALPHVAEDCPKIDGLYGTSRFDKKKLTATSIEGGYRYDIDGEFLADGKEHVVTRKTHPHEGSYVANCKNGRLTISANETATDAEGNTVSKKAMSLQLYIVNEELDLVMEADDGKRIEKKLITNMTPQPLIANMAEVNAHDPKACPSFAGQVEISEVGSASKSQGAITIEQQPAGPKYIVTAENETVIEATADGKARRAKHEKVPEGDTLKTSCHAGTLHFVWMKAGDIIQHWKFKQQTPSTSDLQIRGLNNEGEVKSVKIDFTLKPQT